MNRLLGTHFDRAAIAALLARVDVAVADAGSGPLRCRVPSWRNDLRRDVDLVEEVARIHGYDHLPTTLPVALLGPVAVSRGRSVVDGARNALCAAGFVECMTLPFASAADLDRIGLPEDDARRRAVRLLNPLTDEESQLRTTLVPSLLGVARTNRSRQVERVRAFEVGRVFAPVVSDELPIETLHVAGVVMRGEGGLWAAPAQPPLFFDAKGAVERLLEDLGLAATFSVDANEPFLHPGASAAIVLGERRVGVVGELHPETAARFETRRALRDLRARSRCDRGDAACTGRGTAKCRASPVSGAISRCCCRASVPARGVLDAIRGTAGPHLVAAEIFDRYEGTGVPEGRVSVAFRLVFQRPDRTLLDTEVARATERVVRMLADRFGGELRQGAGEANQLGG